MAEATPMMKQYREIKAKNADAILFFRLGDFYEMFDEDAKTASRELDLMLTTRDRSKEDPEERVPMCGVPYHSAEAYIARLIAKGYKVAICEQLEDPATAKGLVDRDIVRVVTPGTLIDASMLDEGKPNYICSVCQCAGNTALCFAELSTGECVVSWFPSADTDRLFSELGAYAPAEAILDPGAWENRDLRALLEQRLGSLTQCCADRFDFMQSAMRVCEQFSSPDPDSLGIGDSQEAVCAVGALLSYMKDTQKTDLSHINTLTVNSVSEWMELDMQTLRNLELVQSLNTQEKKGSLLWVLDKTKTPMGRRKIRAWVLRPLLSAAAIKRRQAAVAELFAATVARSEIMVTLRSVGDMERIISKIVYGTANCRDLKALELSIRGVAPALAELGAMKSALLTRIRETDPLTDVADAIRDTIVEDPPFSVREGGMIRPGVSADADYLRNLLNNSTDALAAIETRERERTGKKLKVSYNRVFGYYIEIPRSMSEDVPADYVRKQTLVNCERFITQELKELENTLLTAKDRLAELEYGVFTDLRERIAAQVTRVQETADAVAELDTLCSFAECAVQNNYCQPEVDVSGTVDIRDGRHPVVEVMQRDSLFVPNDTFLDGGDARVAIITGPNMAGKSTYMRQTALIVLMAQMGAFVPARSARIGIVDRVFTRIGASDDLSGGKSTFMVEMTEVADIMKNATARSLIILDEIGRGTSTYDGMAIARAVLEHCADKRKLGAKTLFSTHYHELAALEGEVQGVKNYNITAKKRGGEVIFLRKIVPGGADDSYGIEVAGLAGVPESVIRRAKAHLREFLEGGGRAPARTEEPREEQLSLGDVSGGEIAETLEKTDLNTLTPIEALNLLFELKKKVSHGA